MTRMSYLLYISLITVISYGVTQGTVSISEASCLLSDGKTIYTYDIDHNTIESIYRVPEGGYIVAFAEATSGELYMNIGCPFTTDGSGNTINPFDTYYGIESSYIIRIESPGREPDTLLFTTGNYGEQSSRFGSILLSDDGNYLAIGKYGWEWSRSIVLDLASGNTIFHDLDIQQIEIDDQVINMRRWDYEIPIAWDSKGFLYSVISSYDIEILSYTVFNPSSDSAVVVRDVPSYPRIMADILDRRPSANEDETNYLDNYTIARRMDNRIQIEQLDGTLLQVLPVCSPPYLNFQYCN